MNIHEYQAKELFAKFKIPTPPGIVVTTPNEAAEAYHKLTTRMGAKLAVVKAQVHAGGRGKAGGVKLVKSEDESKNVATEILSKPLVTHQTGAEGVPVTKLLVAAGVDIVKEYYAAIVLDRKRSVPVLIVSSEGGVEIEEVPDDKIIKEPINPARGLLPYQARKLGFLLGFEGEQARQAARIFDGLVKLFFDCDCSLAEINPLIITPPDDKHPDGEVLALDGKINIDDNGLFRQKEIENMADPDQEDPDEIHAREFGLSYISLDGTIGCLVNGAGLAMATMDIIKLHGGEPANFLDVGGSASQEAVTEAFRIILKDPNVNGILVNIFGGIAKCDTIANAIVAAAKEVGFKVPLVVRLEGTNVEAARKILEDAKADIPTMIVADHLTDAAEKITGAVKAA